MRAVLFSTLFTLFTGIESVNFPFESIQLKEKDIEIFSAIAFADRYNSPPKADCKAFPGTKQWPVEDVWAQLNSSLDGALLKPAIPASACYDGPQKNVDFCNYLVYNTSTARFYLNDPISVLTEWPEGDTCPTLINPPGNCTQGGFSTYFVDVATVKQVQIAVNFARNNNIRLVVK